MHINRLNGDQGIQSLCVLQYDVGNQPGISNAVVRINQNLLAAVLFAPLRDFSDASNI